MICVPAYMSSALKQKKKKREKKTKRSRNPVPSTNAHTGSRRTAFQHANLPCSAAWTCSVRNLFERGVCWWQLRNSGWTIRSISVVILNNDNEVRLIVVCEACLVFRLLVTSMPVGNGPIIILSCLSRPSQAQVDQTLCRLQSSSRTHTRVSTFALVRS